jgi:hypothetical protein
MILLFPFMARGRKKEKEKQEEQEEAPTTLDRWFIKAKIAES